MHDRLRDCVSRIWNYHRLEHQLVTADAILVLCSYDESVAVRAAELFLEGWAPLLIFSGGSGAVTRRIWNEPEADRFARVAVDRGVPAEKILIENRSTNTGENIEFTKQLLADRQLDPGSFILVQKPYMERRSFATFRRLWPDKTVVVTSPRISLEEYLESHSDHPVSPDEVISIMVGDLQRIRVYPERGFQIPQVIPTTCGGRSRRWSPPASTGTSCGAERTLHSSPDPVTAARVTPGQLGRLADSLARAMPGFAACKRSDLHREA